MGKEITNGYHNWRKSAAATYSIEKPLSSTFPTSVRTKGGRAVITIHQPLGLKFDVILNRETTELLMRQLSEVVESLPKSELPF